MPVLKAEMPVLGVALVLGVTLVLRALLSSVVWSVYVLTMYVCMCEW